MQNMNKNTSKVILKINNNITSEQKGIMVTTLKVEKKNDWISKKIFINSFKKAKIFVK
jgi:hypothetical protein